MSSSSKNWLGVKLKRNKEILLNPVFLKNRILELGIKQWWLAEQVGVDRKTVIRWVQGKVKSIQIENAEALSKILSCQVSDLTLADAAEQLDTPEDQKNAASLVVTSSLIEKLGPIGEWDVIEGLLKATIVPNLPANVLGELYNQLTVASWRQSKIDQASIYNKKAEELALKSGDKSVLAGALLSKANIFSWRGKSKNAIQTYLSCLGLEKFIEPRVMGSIYSNLSAVLYESGDLTEGEVHQKKAIEIFTFHGKPMNLSIAWCHLAMIYLQTCEMQLATDACNKSDVFAKQGDYLRGSCMAMLIKAEIAAVQGSHLESKNKLLEGLQQFANLGIDEGLNYEFAGRVSKLNDEFVQSESYLRKGISISNDFPMYQAALHLELAKTLALIEGKSSDAKESAKKAADLYSQCEATKRVEMANSFINSIR